MKKKSTATVLDADSHEHGTRRSGGDWLTKIVCLLSAFVIWFYVMQVDSPEHVETFRSVDVTLVNMSVLEDVSGLSIYSGYGSTIDVTVIGKKSEINKLTAEDLTVTADVSEITEGGLHSVPIHVDLPAGLSLDSVSQNSIEVYADEKSSKVVEIQVRLVEFMTEYEVGKTKPRYETVVVTGPKSALDQIDHAEVVLSLGNVTKSIVASGPLSLVDQNGAKIDNPYLRLSRSEVTVDVPVYMKKTLPLTVKYKHGYYNDTNVRVTVTPQEIELRGDPAVLSKMTEFVIAELDETKIARDGILTIKPTFEEGFEPETSLETVVIDIKHIGTNTKTLYVTDIDVVTDDGYHGEPLTERILVTVRGTPTELAELKPSDLSAVVDMRGFTTQSETNIVGTPTIRIDSATAKNVYVIDDPNTDDDDYTVTVKLTKNEKNASASD